MLDRLTLAPVRHSDLRSYRAPDPYPTSQLVAGHLRTRSNIRDALRAAINGGISSMDANIEHDKIKRDALSGIPTPTLLQRSASTDMAYSQAKLTSLHSNRSSVSLSLSLTIAETSLASSPETLFNDTGSPTKRMYSFHESESKSGSEASQ